MIINTISASNCTPQTIVIGRRGTYDTMQIAFDLSFLIENYGSGTAVLAVKRSQDESAYPAVVTQEDNTLTWTISETDTYYVGSGECQLMWYVDGGLAKTIIYPMVVMRDILATAEEPPDGYENWIEHLTELGAETQQNAQEAAQSATEAKASAEAAAESEKKAEDAADLLENVYATATTLEPGQPATAEYDEGVFKFGIPKGDKLTYADLTEADKEDLVQGPIQEAQTSAVNAVGAARVNAVNAVNGAGTTQVQNVNSAGTTNVNAVNQAGETQVNTVNQAGATQAQAVEDKGEEVIASIPSDYSDLTAEVDDLTRQLSDETTGLNSKAPVILETVSGAIASFDDGADGMPIRKLVAQIKPVQDLHGYANPWPGGGSKNLLKLTIANVKARNTAGTWNGNVYTYNGVAVTLLTDSSGINVIGVNVNGTASSIVMFQIPYDIPVDESYPIYILTGCPAGGSLTTYYLDCRSDASSQLQDTGNGVTFNSRGQTNKISQIIVLSGITVQNVVFHPMLRLASAGSEFVPYSNLCPISGHTGAEIEQRGKNLAPFNNTYSVSADSVWFNLTCHLKPGTYVFTYNPSISTGSITFKVFDKDGNIIYANGGIGNRISRITFTISEDAYSITSYSNSSLTISEPMIRLASDADNTFAPYTGNQISVTFPSEAGTVYGGEDEVISGKLKSTMAMVDLGTLNWTYRSDVKEGLFSAVLPDYKLSQNVKAICSNYKIHGTVTAASGVTNEGIYLYYNIYNPSSATRQLYVLDKRFSTVADFKIAMSGVQLCYELAEPVEYTLTGNEMETLYGQNNIWSSTGDTEVTYPADTKLYIDNKITQAIAAALNA